MTYSLPVPEIVAGYRNGVSVAALAARYRVDSSVIKSRLVKAGVPVRGSSAAMRANLARDPSIRDRMGRPPTHPVDPTFFDRMTPDAAYIVGLLQADGSNQVSRGMILITLKGSDAPHLEEVASAMGATRPLHVIPNGNRRLCITNMELSRGLARWGVVSPKTHTASTHPDLLLNRDCWRGVIDGDGSLCESRGRKILTLVGSRFLCNEFLDFAQLHGLGHRCGVHPHKNIFIVRLNGPEAASMAALLYSGAHLALPRKRAKAENWTDINMGVVPDQLLFTINEESADGA